MAQERRSEVKNPKKPFEEEEFDFEETSLSTSDDSEEEEEDEDEDEDELEEEEDDDGLFDDDNLDDGPIRTRALKKASEKAAAVLDKPDFGDTDIRDLNNPDVISLQNVPTLGGRGSTELFGVGAETFGRPTSPKLYASAGQFASCPQFRVWRMENGIPVGLGAIDSEASEDDFVRQFYDAMPRQGDSRFQFVFRPIDQRGREMGKEFTVNISEHHAMLRRLREQEKQEAPSPFGNLPWGRGPGGGDVHVHGGGGDEATASLAEQMGDMFNTAVERAEQQNERLAMQLEREREEMRMEQQERANERVSLAARAAETTEKMMERMMASDRQRADELSRTREESNKVMMNTLTTVFQQQQQASREQAERLRESDLIRLEQDRAYFERQRLEAEERRRIDREEYERKREYELQQMRAETERREADMKLRLEREKMEMEQRREELRAERERLRQEAEDKRIRDQQELDRKLLLDREERDRREAENRERWEREKLAWEQRREDERRDWEKKEAQRRLEQEQAAERRKEDLLMQMKQLEVDSQRAREHQERMAEQARLDREAAREAADRREKLEREIREAAERQRQRNHEMEMKQIENQRQADREHQERMLTLSKMQQSGGFSGLTEMLGMETPELLGRIFGGGGEDSGNWSDTLAKVLGGLVDVGKVAMSQQAQMQASPPPPQITQQQQQQNLIPLQTPDGVKYFTPQQIQMMQQARAAQQQQQQQQQQAAAQQQQTAAQQPAQPEKPVQTEKVEPPNSSDLAKQAGMSVREIRDARKALRKLAEQVETAPEEKWEELLTAAILRTPAIFGYIQAVSVRLALAEVIKEEELSKRIENTLRNHSMVPSDLKYTLSDGEE